MPITDRPYILFLAATASLGGLLFGFDIAIITGAGPFLIRYFDLHDISLGWAFSSLLFGCLLGSLAAGTLTDRFGRRKILLWVAALFAATSLATALAPNFPAFLLARFLGGVAVGAVSLLSPMYIAEVAPSDIRGRLGAFYQLSIIVGILASYGINYLLRNSGSANWRWMFLTGIAPSLVFFCLMLFAPETPRFLMKAGRTREAIQILTSISGPALAQSESLNIQATLHGQRTRWTDLWNSAIRPATLVGFWLAILIQVSGINTIVDYAPAIFTSAGWQIDGALRATLLVGVTEFVFTLASFWMIDRFGRKPLYLAGSLGMSAALILLLLTALFHSFSGPLVMVLILVYLAFFAACIGPVFWTLVPEIFPNHMRGTAMTVPVLTQWGANALVVLLFPYAFHQIGKTWTFGFLAAMSFAQAGVTWLFVPETKGKTLEQIEASWALLKNAPTPSKN